MRRSLVFTATALVAGFLYIGCTQDFDQFEPDNTFTTSSGSGGAGVSSSAAATGTPASTGAGGNGGTGGSVASVASSSSSGIPGGCMADTDCQPSTFCKTWECNAGLCSFTDTNGGTPLPDPDQTANDCKVVQCDGSGNEETVEDGADEPMADGNPCTDDVCNGDMPEHPPRPAGTPCMGNKMCDGNGNCV
jgi:hypothetical protein